jgi:trigger factor
MRRLKIPLLKKITGDTVDFNIRKALPDDNEIAGLLRIDKEKIENISETYRMTIKEISRFYPAEIGQDLFDKIYGENTVKTEEEFNKKIEEEIAASLKGESNYKLMQDIRNMVIEKTDIPLPEDFLKKWLLKVNENTTSEQIEKEFDSFKKTSNGN